MLCEPAFVVSCLHRLCFLLISKKVLCEMPPSCPAFRREDGGTFWKLSQPRDKGEWKPCMWSHGLSMFRKCSLFPWQHTWYLVQVSWGEFPEHHCGGKIQKEPTRTAVPFLCKQTAPRPAFLLRGFWWAGFSGAWQVSLKGFHGQGRKSLITP